MITTERLKLRLPEPRDLEAIYAIFSDPDVMTYWATAPHANMEETRAWLQPLLDDPAQSPCDFFIEYEGRIVGKLGCWKIPEIGFALAKAYWGQAIATEAMDAFIRFMKIQKLSDHLFADVDPRNLRSKNLLQKFGFRHVAFAQQTIKTHLGWCDSDYYQLDL